MGVEFELWDTEAVILIHHRGRPGEKSEEERIAERRQVREYLEQQPGRCAVVVDFSEAKWSFAEQVISLGGMIDHFRDLGGVDFLIGRMDLFVIGDNDTAHTIVGALQQDQYGSIPVKMVDSLEEALALARRQQQAG